VLLWVGVVAGLGVDFLSCRLAIRRRQLGRGPSPIPIVALFFYMIRIFLRPWDRMHEVDRSWTFVGLAVLLAVLIHVTLQVLLPLAVTRRA
jgi:hypothetical protein